jgi:hypothetical protein
VLLSRAIKKGGSETETVNKTDSDAEKAAWLAVRSMATIAEKYWETTQEDSSYSEEAENDANQNGNCYENDANNESGANPGSTSRDTRALELRRLVYEDDTIVGDLFRSIGNRTESEPQQQQQQQQRRQQQRRRVSRKQHRPLVRFRDETWQDLYGFLHKVLCESHGLDDQVLDDDGIHGNYNNNNNNTNNNENNGAQEEEETEQQQQQRCCCGNSTGVYDKEAIALVVGLVFGETTTSLQAALVTPVLRQKLETIARACCKSINRSTSRDNDFSTQQQQQQQHQQGYGLSKSRCYLLSLRLADEGLWDTASDILQSRSSFGVELKTEESESSSNSNSNNDSLLLSIDGMIYTATFLIDRLYSQTYVRKDEDTKELAIAVRLGRKAVGMAEKRYKAIAHGSAAAATATSKPEITTSSLLQANNNNHHLSPPPPMESLFANDVLRYLHAKLALGKALALLAQHVGLEASNTSYLRTQHKILPLLAAADEEENKEATTTTKLLLPVTTPPTVRTEDEEYRRHIEDYPDLLERFEWTESFFEESRHQLRDGLVVCEEQQKARSEGTNVSILPLRGALESANAERSYCASTVSYAMRRPHRMHHQILSSISSFSMAFRTMMEGVLNETVFRPNNYDDSHHNAKNKDDKKRSCAWVETTLDTLLRCGKDLGKTCGFADYVGVDYNGAWNNNSNNEGHPRHIDPQLFLAFAHLVSIYRYGSFHPTTENIEQLLERRDSGFRTRPLAPKHLAMVTWLVAEYGGNHRRS